MCAPDSIRSTRFLLRNCPDEGHANDQLQFPDRNAMIQSEDLLQCVFLNENPSVARYHSDSHCLQPSTAIALSLHGL